MTTTATPPTLSQVPDRWLVVHFRDGNAYRVLAEGEPALEAAVLRYLGDAARAYLPDAEGIDSLITLTSTGGMPVKLLASSVARWELCTPESRVLEDRVNAIQNDTARETAAASTPSPSES